MPEPMDLPAVVKRASFSSIRFYIDVSSMGVLGRLNRSSRLASLDVQKFMRQFGLEPWESDVLATLRRSAAEAP